MCATLILATILDLALAVLLVWISGLIFGPGPESANGEALAVAAWSLALAGCLIAPVSGFYLRSRGKAGLASLIATLPLVSGLFFLAI